MQSKEEILKNKIIEECLTTSDIQQIELYEGDPSHWIIDFRKIIMTPETLNMYADMFFERFENQYPFQVCGLEVAAIPLISAIVMKSVEKGKPVNGFFIRKSRKKSGLLNMIEGKINNQKVILVDDIMNSGSSFIRQIEVLEKISKEEKIEDIKEEKVFSILRFRDIEYYQYFKEKNIGIESILELDDLSRQANNKNPNLNIKNLVKKEKEYPANLFEVIWGFRGLKPNYFYVVPKSGSVFNDGKVFFGTDSGDFYCLDSSNGETIWKYKVPFGSNKKLIFSTPCILDDTVYFGTYDGNLYALNKNTGKRKWVFTEADWIGSSPTYSKELNLIYIGMEYGLFNKQGGVTAINSKNGEKVWEYRSENLTHGSPSYSKKYNIVACGSNDKKMHVLNAKSGKLLWSLETISEIKYAPCIDEKNGLIIFGGVGGDLEKEDKSPIYVCDIKSGKIKYTFDEMYFGTYSTPVIYENICIVSSLDKNIYAFNIKDGKLIWKYNTGARIFATPVIFDNKLYIGNNSSRFYEIDPLTGKILSISHFTERIVNKISFDKDTKTIFLSTFANEVYALKKK